ncbi:MAG: hypothetical protein P4L86_17510, partial [Mycobacterium sp.]|nr:hypothetical protein [Mycobacterium sp.]
YDRLLVSQPQYPFTFLWTCTDVTAGRPCALPPSVSMTGVQVTVPGDVALAAFQPGFVYSWTVSIKSLFDGRSASSVAVDVTMTTSTSAIYPTVVIDEPTSVLSISQPVWLRGVATAGAGSTVANLEYAWSCDAVGVDLTAAAVNLGTPNTETIGVSGSLMGGGPRRFTLSVTDPTVIDPNTGLAVSATASRTVMILSPPIGGTCSLTPATGASMTTDFVVLCSGWVDPNIGDGTGSASLSYSLAGADTTSSCTHLATPLVPTGALAELTSTNVRLPQSDMDLMVTVGSSTGTFTVFHLLPVVVVAPPTNVTLAANPALFVSELTPALLTPLVAASDRFGLASMV